MSVESSETLESLLESAESEVEETSGTIESEIEAAEAANKRRVGKDRGAISLIIISTYTAAVLIMFWYILFTVPDCANLEKDVCSVVTGAWDKQADLLLNSITVAVLPIVTLMLGFYFGTAVSGNEGPKE